MTKYYVFVIVLCSCIFSLVIVTLLVSGTPFEQKSIALDRQRLKAFNTIKSQIEVYSYTKGQPQNLSQVTSLNSGYYAKSLRDPETGKPYDYKVISDTSFQLCTTFSTGSSKQDKFTMESLGVSNISYKKGYNCFSYKVDVNRSPKRIYLSPTPTSRPSPIPIPKAIAFPTIEPDSIGLTLEKTPDGNNVKLKVTNTDGMTRIDYDLYYHALESGNTVTKSKRGSYYNSNLSGQYLTRIELGECSAGTCNYDKSVSDINLILTIAKTDGRNYQVQKTLAN